ncbi:MAG: ABC transporter permease [Flavobacteriales bacterium]
MIHKPEIISNRSSLFTFSDIGRYRELLWMLAWRDFRIRYAQTAIGLVWAFIQPVLTITILYVIFGRFAQVDTGGVPHIVYTASGLLGWTYFAYVMQNSGNSIITAQAMVKKIYFPRIIVPLSKALVGLIDLGVNAIVLALLMVVFDVPISVNFYVLPVFILMALMAALGIGIWLSALTIRFRDFQYVVPFMVQLGLYITPTAYPAEFAISKLPQWASFIYFMNPMAGVVEGIRWSILDTQAPSGLSYVSFIAVPVLFITSLFYFQKIDGKIADLV